MLNHSKEITASSMHNKLNDADFGSSWWDHSCWEGWNGNPKQSEERIHIIFIPVKFI